MPIKTVTVILLALFAFGTLYQTNLYAQNQSRDTSGSKAIIVEGVGKTADEAIKDAFRNAIRQAVGAIVDAETIVENDQIIEDKILTYSDAIIRRYEEIQGSKRIQDGLHRIRIKAFVEKTTLEKRLRDAKVVMQEVDGEGLFAEAVTGFEKDHDAAALLRRQFEAFPLAYMQGQTVGKPEVIKKDESGAVVDLTVEITVDMDNYKKFISQLTKSLQSINAKPFKYSAEMELHKGFNLMMTSPGKPLSDYATLVRSIANTGDDRRQVRPLFVASNVGKNFDCYSLPENLFEVVNEVANREFDIKLSLLDSEEIVITEDTFQSVAIELPKLGSHGRFVPSLITPQGIYNLPDFPVYFVTPFFVSRDAAYIHISKNLVSRRSFKLTHEELQSIKSSKVELSLRDKRPEAGIGENQRNR